VVRLYDLGGAEIADVSGGYARAVFFDDAGYVPWALRAWVFAVQVSLDFPYQAFSMEPVNRRSKPTRVRTRNVSRELHPEVYRVSRDYSVASIERRHYGGLEVCRATAVGLCPTGAYSTSSMSGRLSLYHNRLGYSGQVAEAERFRSV
jgi:hypothetical protein